MTLIQHKYHRISHVALGHSENILAENPDLTQSAHDWLQMHALGQAVLTLMLGLSDECKDGSFCDGSI